MSGLSQWAWQICIACIVAAAARMIFPGGQMKPVINVILTLYIVTAVLPLTSRDWSWNWPELEEAALQTREYQDYSQQLYLSAVEEELARQLEEAGIEGEIRISLEGNCMLQTKQTLWEQAVQVLRQSGWQGGIIQEESSQ